MINNAFQISGENIDFRLMVLGQLVKYLEQSKFRAYLTLYIKIKIQMV